ncbi:MAG: hypothetical protein R2911_40965 [Caldilineaceae bacterium]
MQAAQVYHFQARAAGYADDAAIWDALRTRNDVAIVTPDYLLTDTTGPSADSIATNSHSEAPPAEIPLPFLLYNVEPSVENLPNSGSVPANSDNPFGDTRPITDAVATSAPDHRRAGRQQHLGGRPNPDNLAALALTGQPATPDHFYVKVQAGADVHVVAGELERAFLSSGLDAAVMARPLPPVATWRAAFCSSSVFTSSWVLVGIAALGVISSRTVVERRQQEWACCARLAIWQHGRLLLCARSQLHRRQPASSSARRRG